MQKNNRKLYWILAVEFLGICFFITVFAVVYWNNLFDSTSKSVLMPESGVTPIVTNTETDTSPAQLATELIATEVVTSDPTLAVNGSALFPGSDSVLSDEDLNTIPPTDILQEINFYGGLGRGGDCFQKPSYPEPEFDYGEDYSSIEIMQLIYITICGIAPGEIVTVEMIAPDGSSRIFTGDFNEHPWISGSSSASEDGVVDNYTFRYRPDYFDQRGSYVIEFSGAYWTLYYYLEVSDTVEPSIFSTKEGYLAFSGFAPEEVVRFFVYKIDELSYRSKLFGWTEFKMTAYGRYIIKNELTDAVFASVGEQSGEVFVTSVETYGLAARDIYCVGALPPANIQIHSYAQVVASQIILDSGETLRSGDLLYISDGAFCKNNTFVWQASYCQYECETFNVPESGLEGYYLMPRPDVTATPGQ